MPAPLALLPSPLLGPSVWQPVARVLTGRGWQATTSAVVGPVRTGKDALDGFLAALPTEQDLVLVAHSNAGAYIPALVTHRRVVAVVFVDAVLPPSLGNVPLAPPSFVDFLRVKADDSGLLPGWTEWWDEADVAALFPDAATRVRVEREQRRLPLSYFEGALTVPPGWDETPGAFLAFGDAYASERDEAIRRGWPVTTLPAEHLHQLIDPDQVAIELVTLLGRLGIDEPEN